MPVGAIKIVMHEKTKIAKNQVLKQILIALYLCKVGLNKFIYVSGKDNHRKILIF